MVRREVIERAPDRVGTQSRDGFGGAIGPGHGEYPVAVDQRPDHRPAHEPGSSRYEEPQILRRSVTPLEGSDPNASTAFSAFTGLSVVGEQTKCLGRDLRDISRVSRGRRIVRCHLEGETVRYATGVLQIPRHSQHAWIRASFE